MKQSLNFQTNSSNTLNNDLNANENQQNNQLKKYNYCLPNQTIFNENSNIETNHNEEQPKSKYTYTENIALKEKFLEALAGNKNNKKHFQVVYMFKKRIKRMFRIDCMTRKINV